MPKASIIVPVYRVAAYLPQCVDSLLAQTERDIEIILVDDGSPDDCPRMVDAYAARDARVKAVHQDNGGLSAARNAGLKTATGEYILCIDADDWVEHTLVADAVAAADAHHAEQVLWNYRRAFDDHTEGAYLPMRGEVIDLGKLGLANYFYRYWFPYVHGQEAWCRLYRRDVIERHQLAYTPGQEIFAEDTLFSAMYLLHVRTLAVLDKPYLYYRQRGDSIMAMKKPRLARRMIELGKRFADYAEQQGFSRTLRHVLPMFFYRLAVKGIAHDADPDETKCAIADAAQQPTVRALLRALIFGGALPVYLLKTGKGIRTQWRARALALAWLRGDTRRVIHLVEKA